MNSRLQQFLELENLTPARLADIMGIQRSGLSHILSGRNKPSYDFLHKLLMKFPHINGDWLMTGRGKAYNDFGENSQGSVISSSPLPGSKNERFSGVNGVAGYGNGHPGGMPFGNVTQVGAPAYGNGTQPGGSGYGNGGQVGGAGLGNSGQLGGAPYNNAPFGAPNYDDVPILDGFDEIFLEEQKEATGEDTPYSTENEQTNPNNTASQPSENGVKAHSKGCDCKKKRIKRVIVFYNDGSFDELFPHIR